MLVRSSTRVVSRAVAARSVPTLTQATRSYSSNGQQYSSGSSSSSYVPYALAAGGASLILLGLTTSDVHNAAATEKVDYDKVREAIAAILDKEGYDDGSIGPVLVRLAWHASGTYDKHTKTGGSDGGCIRFKPEADAGANAGLTLARSFLEPIKKQFPAITYADLYTLAGAVAIEEMGGPKIPWRPGRVDDSDGRRAQQADKRLPDATQGAQHTRDIFYRMGFNDREIVALIGAHSLGRCHTDRSGFKGPWTFAPTTFSNEFYRVLLEEKWIPKKWDGPHQYQDMRTGELMMTPNDLSFIVDANFKKIVEEYAKDEAAFRKDFASAFAKLLELGVSFPNQNKSWWSKIFG